LFRSNTSLLAVDAVVRDGLLRLLATVKLVEVTGVYSAVLAGWPASRKLS
jgi:hypothetical protein